MHATRSILFAIVAAAVVVVGCTSERSADDNDTAEPTTTTVTFNGRVPSEITTPPAEGAGLNQPQPAAVDLPEDYIQEEFFIGGTATSFEAIDTPDDGFWSAAPDEEADYRTRVIVRRPAEPVDFNGTVLVEWFNISAIEAAPDWAFLADAIVRGGYAYVGVSTQELGVMGGESLIALGDDTPAGEAVDSGGLVNIDPERYGTLSHPGDAFAFDIFSQVGRSIAQDPTQLLGDLVPTQIIAMGESQSAMFMSTLINAVHPLDPVYDAFLVHSRGALVPAVDGTYVRSRQGETYPELLERGVLIRTDLDVPVMIVEAETDLTVLGYAHARQSDTDLIRTWEIAGTAHADSETLRAVIGGPRDPSIGSILGCGSINSGPHKEVLRAALAHLNGWAAGGDAPPEGERIETTDGDEVSIVRGEDGNAIGGVRNPMLDVPAAVLSGDPPGGGGIDDLTDSGGICLLFGQTIPFDSATMIERYGDGDTYMSQFRASAQDAVDGGFLLDADVAALVEDMEPNRELFG